MNQDFDPYRALDLAYGVTNEEIKAKYRMLVKKFHPDHNKNPQAQQKLQDVIRAYNILSDPRKKEIFDKNREEKIYGQYRPNQSSNDFFDGLKSFASKWANDFIEDFTDDIEKDSIDPRIYDICSIETRSSYSNHEIKIKIPKKFIKVWGQDRDYWIDQLCNCIEQDLKRKI